MGMGVMIHGKSGSGKSYATRNMDKKSTIVYNVAGKPMPYKGKFDMMITVSDPQEIMKSLRRNTSNCYVIDDSQYLMAFKLINRINDTGYAKYTEIAKDFKDLMDVITYETSPDTIVYFLHHNETLEDGFIKAKTLGKMIDNWLTLEGLFSIVLMAMVSDNKHLFVTQSDGSNSCKSPVDMFDNPMDNDLALVDRKIREFYELNPAGLIKRDSSVTTASKIPG